MGAETARRPNDDAIIQFSVFSENKVGRLNELILMLSSNKLHIMAMCLVDTTDCTITRFVVDYPEEARRLFEETGTAYTECEVIGVEIEDESHVKEVTCALVQAEINIATTYPFLMRPRGKCGLLLRVEDNELAAEILNRQGVKVLRQSDIAR